MSLQHERITALCEQLKLARLGCDWFALAQNAAKNGASFADSWRRYSSASRWHVKNVNARC